MFKNEALRYGEVVYARAYAPWDIFPEAMSIFDRHDIKPEYVEGGRKDNADLVMSLSIQEFLRVPGRGSDVFILVTGDGDFVHVIRLLQQEQKRVIVWGVEGSISARLMSRVSEVVNIQDLMRTNGLVPKGAGEGRPARPLDACGGRDLALRALVLRAEAVMLARGWVQVPFLTLMQEMSVSTLFGEDSEQRRLLIVRCLELGILETKKQPNPKRPGTDTTFVLLKKDNPLVAHTLHSVHRVILHMRHLLNNMPGALWVAYGLLDKALSQIQDDDDQWLSEPERRAWIDLCIIEGMMRLEKKDNPKNPTFPTSALYLVDDHPIVEQVVPGEDLTPMLKRLALIVDHYLTRTGYMWMSIGLLRQQLAPFGQQAMERTIRTANETGIIVIRQQPNQFGSRPTTGAYLQYEHEVVRAVLQTRDQLLHALARLYQGRDIVPTTEVAAALRSSGSLTDWCDGPETWLDMLIRQQVLVRATTAEGEPGYVLQKQHPVVVKRVQVHL